MASPSTEGRLKSGAFVPTERSAELSGISFCAWSAWGATSAISAMSVAKRGKRFVFILFMSLGVVCYKKGLFDDVGRGVKALLEGEAVGKGFPTAEVPNNTLRLSEFISRLCRRLALQFIRTSIRKECDLLFVII